MSTEGFASMIRHKTRASALLLSLASISLTAATGALAAEGAALAKQCAACHGENGASRDSSIPIIGGFSTKYIVESIKNFKRKARTCAEVTVQAGPKKGTKSDMCKVVADLSEADVEAVARHLAAQKFVRAKQPFDEARAKRGSEVYKQRCEKCHENGGSSPDEDNGILAGQWTPYVKEQLSGFRAGRRPLDDKMKLRLEKVGKEDEEALLHFFASQQ
jgi:sulfide dehydrogenase cytochrome subunit